MPKANPIVVYFASNVWGPDGCEEPNCDVFLLPLDAALAAHMLDQLNLAALLRQEYPVDAVVEIAFHGDFYMHDPADLDGIEERGEYLDSFNLWSRPRPLTAEEAGRLIDMSVAISTDLDRWDYYSDGTAYRRATVKGGSIPLETMAVQREMLLDTLDLLTGRGRR